MEWKKGNYSRVLFILFTMYIAALTWIILFKLTVPSNITILSRERILNPIPFYDILTDKYFNWFDVIANIIVFIPFGIYTALMLKDIPTRYKVMTAALLSILYEAMQFIFAIGVSDITDVMMNSLGAYIGIQIFSFISERLICELKTRRFVTICSALSAFPLCTVLSVVSVIKNIA
ncbi:MAG: VanZ family protein [Clostridia bacterium]|nr:VanZ family protein [Clostridia bacterium]